QMMQVKSTGVGRPGVPAADIRRCDSPAACAGVRIRICVAAGRPDHRESCAAIVAGPAPVHFARRPGVRAARPFGSALVRLAPLPLAGWHSAALARAAHPDRLALVPVALLPGPVADRPVRE